MKAARKVRLAPIYIALVLLALVSVVPFLWMLATSFKHGSDVYTKVPSLLPLDRKTGEFSPPWRTTSTSCRSAGWARRSSTASGSA